MASAAARLAASARLCLWALLALLVLRCVDGQVVTVSSGSVRGVRVGGLGGARDYWAFRGIRYAAPPVGDLRFKAPRPAVPWEGVADATVEGSRCPQVQDGSVVGSEDCLNVNVYTPTLDCPADGYAVIVFFYGGSLVEGSNSNAPYFGPDFLVHNDVVLVLPNYRVNALGFLNLDTRGVPGNAGIKDGLAALRWVRDNAAAFCGDSARVTAMGQSAGAKLVAFMALAEGSRGLFRAAIQMSGTAVSPMAYTELHVERALALAERLGGSGADAAAAERTLLQADWRALTGQADAMYNSAGWGLPYNPFVASPEGRPADGEEVVLSRDPESLLRDPLVPRVPTLTGVTSAEGITFSHQAYHSEARLAAMGANLTALLRSDVAYVGAATARARGVATTPTDAVLEEIAGRVKDKYFQGREPSADFPAGLAYLLGDMRYAYPLYRWARRLDNQSAPLYLYLFDQDTDFNFMKPEHYPVPGAAHADDLAYTFRVTKKVMYQSLDGAGAGNQTLRDHVRLVTDFAKNLTSPAIAGADIAGAAGDRRRFPPYLYIGPQSQEQRVEDTFGAQGRLAFWDDVVEGLLLDPRRSPASGSPRRSASALLGVTAVVGVLLRVAAR